MASKQKLLKEYRPESKDLWPDFRKAMLWAPAYPQDYAPRNQHLHPVLKKKTSAAIAPASATPRQNGSSATTACAGTVPARYSPKSTVAAQAVVLSIPLAGRKRG